MPEDPELLYRYAQDGSEEAFAELVRRHVDLVYGAALRKLGGNVHRAQDVTQVVFTGLAKKAGRLTEHPSLAGWLYVSAHHAAAELMRGEQRREAREEEAAIMNESLGGESPIDWAETRPVLAEAVLELPPGDREVVLLRYYQRKPFRDIAAALRLSEDAARRRTDRAVQRLRAMLARRGITSTAAALAAGLAGEGAFAAPAGLAATVSGAAVASVAAAGAGGATGTAAAVVAFMSTSNIGAAVIAAAAILALVGAGQLYRQHRALETALGAAEVQRMAD